jgi:hypothetical protein
VRTNCRFPFLEDDASGRFARHAASALAQS